MQVSNGNASLTSDDQATVYHAQTIMQPDIKKTEHLMCFDHHEDSSQYLRFHYCSLVLLTSGPCPVSKRLAKQKFSTWGFPINLHEVEIFWLSCLANRLLTGHLVFSTDNTNRTDSECPGVAWTSQRDILTKQYVVVE